MSKYRNDWEDPKYDNNWFWVVSGKIYVVKDGSWFGANTNARYIRGPRLERPHALTCEVVFLPSEYMV